MEINLINRKDHFVRIIAPLIEPHLEHDLCERLRQGICVGYKSVDGMCCCQARNTITCDKAKNVSNDDCLQS